MKRLLGIILVSFLGTPSLIWGADAPAQTPKPVPVVMYDFLGNLVRLQPLMVSDKTFKDKKNEKEIAERLHGFVDFSKRLSHSQRLDTATLQLSAKALQTHLAETYDVFISGRKDYARRMLHATLDGCGSCHSQVQQDPKTRFEFKSNELKGSAFDKAEFLFAVRHYDEALKHYNESINAANQGKLKDTETLETALRRKLFIFVRAKRDFAQATEAFKSDLRNKQWPKYLREEVQGWVDALKKTSPASLESPTAESLEAMASKTIAPLLKGNAGYSPEATVQFLNVSGMIFNFINTHSPDDVTPGLLYWLAISDKYLNRGYFFSFNDIYLKECIRRFPKTSMAEKCYGELEASTLDAYTGSSGTHLPKEVKDELDEFKGKLKP